jgi:hypothetical protein
MNDVDNIYSFFWLDGKSEVLKGVSVADAFCRGGYGGGAIKALDFTAHGDVTENYIWDETKHVWNKKEIT